MRTNEERIRLMHQKALLIEQENREKKIRWLQYGSVGLAFAMTILLALIMPRFAQLSIEGAVPDNMIASIFADSTRYAPSSAKRETLRGRSWFSQKRLFQP